MNKYISDIEVSVFDREREDDANKKCDEMLEYIFKEEKKDNLRTEIEELDSIIKLIQDLRKDAINIVMSYACMLGELEEMKDELST